MTGPYRPILTPAVLREALPGLLARPPWPLSLPADALLVRQLARELRPQCPPELRRPALGYSDVLILRWEREDGTAVAVKRPRTPEALASLRKERQVLRDLAADDRTAPSRRLLPRIVDDRLDAAHPALLLEWLPGLPANALLGSHPEDATRITRRAVAAVGELHVPGGRFEIPGDLVDAWTVPRLAVLAEQLPWCRSGVGAAGLAAVVRRLHTDLAHRRTRVGWTHGDFAPDNVLLDDDGLRVTGLVDWSDGTPDGPSEIDACTFALALRSVFESRCWGGQVVDALRTGALPAEEVGADQPPEIVLLTWLWHVAAQLRKSRRYARNRGWQQAVVAPVLEEAASWT